MIRKILVISNFSGSLVNFRLELLGAFLESGLEVHVAAPNLRADSDTFSILDSLGIYQHDITISRNSLNPVREITSLFSIYFLIKAIKPDYLFCYTIKPVLYGNLLGRLLGVKTRFSMITGLGYTFQKSTNVKFYFLSKAVKSLYRLALSKTDAVFFQNQTTKAF